MTKEERLPIIVASVQQYKCSACKDQCHKTEVDWEASDLPTVICLSCTEPADIIKHFV